MSVPARLARAAESGRGRLALAALAGAALTAAQPPVFAWPLIFLAVPGLAWLLSRAPSGRAAFAVGWAAGGAYFLTGLYWVVEAFLVDIARHGWMAPFAVSGLAAGLGLFWAVAFRLAWGLAPRGWPLALALAAAWTLADYARAYVLTGFPWALTAYAWADTPVSQAAALFGPHVLGLLTLALAALPAAPWLGEARPPRPRALSLAALALAAAAVFAAWDRGAARLAQPAPPEGPVIRLVQPNAGQREKWRPEMIPVFFERLRDLSAPGPGEAAPALVIWPETAIPWLLEREPEVRRLIAESAGGASVLLGARRLVRDETPGRPWRNAMTVLGPDGEILGSYDKRHLVPFGEYVPLHGAARALGLGPMVGESGGFGRGTGPARLSVPGLPDLVPRICYETIFPHAMPEAAPDRPRWIAQVTNDAWFGATAGPWQHFHQARMRAIEQGLPVARAANTGISAIIDARGRVVASLGLLEAGAVQAPLPGALPPTPYARLGDLPGMVAAALLLLVCAVPGFLTRRRPAA